MLARGYIGETQLGAALAAQRNARHGKIGEWLSQLGFVTEKQLVTALALQWACPTLSFPADSEQCDLLPQPMRHSLRAVPVRFVAARHVLYLAVSSQAHHTILRGMEVMLECKALPCVVSDATMDRLLQQAKPPSGSNVQVFERVIEAGEMARIATSYVARVGADEVRAVECGPYIWLRLLSRAHATDLLFTSMAPGRTSASESPSSDEGPRAKRLVG